MNEKELICLLLDYYSQKNKPIKDNTHKEDIESIKEIINGFEDSNNKILQELDKYIKNANQRFTNMNNRIDKIEHEMNKYTTNTVHTKEQNKTTKLRKKTNKNKSKRKHMEEVRRKILNALPEYSEDELVSLKKELEIKLKNSSADPKVLSKIANEEGYTVKKLSITLDMSRGTVLSCLNNLLAEDSISRYKLTPYEKSPVIYFKISGGSVPEEKNNSPPKEPNKNLEDEVYQFKDRFNNPGYDLINGLSVKPCQGNSKPLYLNAKQLHELSKLVTDPFTIKSHDNLCTKMKDMGMVNDGTIEAFCYRLVKGFFDEVIGEYRNYQKKIFNPDFKILSGYLLINEEHKIAVKDVKDILRNIPYGDENKIFNYSKELIDKKYTKYPSEAIHTIIENSDILNDMLKDKTVVENNPQKRREKGIL